MTSGESASTLLHSFDPVPQLLENVKLGADAAPLADVNVKAVIHAQKPHRRSSALELYAVKLKATCYPAAAYRRGEANEIGPLARSYPSID